MVKLIPTPVLDRKGQLFTAEGTHWIWKRDEFVEYTPFSVHMEEVGVIVS